MKLTYNDEQHAYWLDGNRCKSVTAVAKIPDDTYALDQWRKRQVAIGLALSPPLVERVAAHYDDRKQLDRIAEEAMTVAKAHEAGGRGVAAHRITERLDLEQLVIDTPLSDAVKAAWTEALTNAQLGVVPEYIERIVVYPEQRIAGRFDRIFRRPDGSLVIGDLKTGERAVDYPHSIACQLALYAHAPLMAGPIPNGGGSTEQFEPLPDELNRRRGVVIHLTAGGTVDVYEIDIDAGWGVCERIIFPVLEWRRHSGLIVPLGVTVDRAPDPANSIGNEWVAERLRTLAANDTARATVARLWPDGCPPKPPWTAEQVDAIATVLDRVETDVQAPFPPEQPSRDCQHCQGIGFITERTFSSSGIMHADAVCEACGGTGIRQAVIPEATAPPPVLRPPPDSDGELVADEDVAALRKEILALPEDRKVRCQLWATEARSDDRSFDPQPDKTMRLRHWAVARAAVFCARDFPDEAAVRSALATVLEMAELPSTWRTGAVFGSLTVDETNRLADLAARFASDQEMQHRLLVGF